MIRLDQVERYDPVPESEVEWEDLLYRLELMLKGLPVTLEQADDSPRVGKILDELVRREAEVAIFLRNACAEDEGGAGVASRDPETLHAIEDKLVEFRRLRARVFAVVQRRGIEVWSWTGALSGGGRPTIFRVLRHLQQEDTRALAAIRETEAAAPC